MTYVWYCEKCGKKVEEIWQKFIKDEDKKRPCECGGTMELRTFAPLGIKFCEKGRYIQDKEFSNDNPNYNFALKQEEERKKNEKVSTAT
jgi:predicted nucleic acid-binding Zn ribbon protein